MLGCTSTARATPSRSINATYASIGTCAGVYEWSAASGKRSGGPIACTCVSQANGGTRKRSGLTVASGARHASSDISPDRPAFDEFLRRINAVAPLRAGAIWTMRLRGFWRPLCPWLGLALLANRPCYWLRRLHPIQDANRRAKIPRPGETSELARPCALATPTPESAQARPGRCPPDDTRCRGPIDLPGQTFNTPAPTCPLPPGRSGRQPPKRISGHTRGRLHFRSTVVTPHNRRSCNESVHRQDGIPHPRGRACVIGIARERTGQAHVQLRIRPADDDGVRHRREHLR